MLQHYQTGTGHPVGGGLGEEGGGEDVCVRRCAGDVWEVWDCSGFSS